MPKKDVGLSCVVSRNGESVIVILGNEDGATTGLDCDAKKLRQIIITLLMAAGVAAQRSGRRPPPNQVPSAQTHSDCSSSCNVFAMISRRCVDPH